MWSQSGLRSAREHLRGVLRGHGRARLTSCAVRAEGMHGPGESVQACSQLPRQLPQHGALTPRAALRKHPTPGGHDASLSGHSLPRAPPAAACAGSCGAAAARTSGAGCAAACAASPCSGGGRGGRGSRAADVRQSRAGAGASQNTTKAMARHATPRCCSLQLPSCY